MPSGYDSTTKDSLGLNVAVLYVGAELAGASVTGDKFGLTKGGLKFDPGVKNRMVEFDGLRAPVAGLEYPIDYDSHIKGDIITLGSAQIGYLLTGADSSTSGGATTYTPLACSTLYSEGDYLADVYMVTTRGDGGLFIVHFPVARVIKWDLDTKDKVENTISVDIQAFLSDTDAQSSTDGAPFRIIDVAAA